MDTKTSYNNTAQKVKFLIKKNVTKSAIFCGFGHICLRNSFKKNLIFFWRVRSLYLKAGTQRYIQKQYV